MRSTLSARLVAVLLFAPCGVGATEPANVTPSLVTSAQASEVLGLDEALQRALRLNPELAVARGEVNATEAARAQAALWPNPELELEIEGSDSSERETTLILSQPLELGGQRAARMDVAEQGWRLAEARYALALADVRSQVLRAFALTLTAQEQARQAERALELANKVLAVTAKRVKAGDVSPVEEIRAQLTATTARTEQRQARGQLEAARLRLAGLWGESHPAFSRLDGELDRLPEPGSRRALEQAVERAPRLVLAQRELMRARALAELEQTRRIPPVTLTAGAKRIEESDETIPVIGFSMPLPLFDRNQGNLLEAQRRIDIARDQLASTRVQVRQELLLAYTQLDTARDEADIMRQDILPSAQGAYDATLKGFELGKFSLLEVLEAQRALDQARTHFVRAQAEAHQALAVIEGIRGMAVAGMEQN